MNNVIFNFLCRSHVILLPLIHFFTIDLYVVGSISHIDFFDIREKKWTAFDWTFSNEYQCFVCVRISMSGSIHWNTLKLFFMSTLPSIWPLTSSPRTPFYVNKHKTLSIIWLFFLLQCKWIAIIIIISMRLFKCLFKLTNGNNKSQNGN